MFRFRNSLFILVSDVSLTYYISKDDDCLFDPYSMSVSLYSTDVTTRKKVMTTGYIFKILSIVNLLQPALFAEHSAQTLSLIVKNVS